MKRTLGTCYYPEHWPREIWKDDARRMVELGLTWVRIGEFSWGQLEPEPGEYRFDWLDDAIEVLGDAGLKVVLGTPTATPPRWMIDRHPDMLAIDVEGRPRKFGSRRHYCFSHEVIKLNVRVSLRRWPKDMVPILMLRHGKRTMSTAAMTRRFHIAMLRDTRSRTGCARTTPGMGMTVISAR